MENIELIKAHSGMLYIVLSYDISYAGFSSYAEKVVEEIQGIVVSQSVLPDVHLWQVSIDGVSFDLVYEDFPQTVSLEATSEAGNEMLRNLFPTLVKLIEVAR